MKDAIRNILNSAFRTHAEHVERNQEQEKHVIKYEPIAGNKIGDWVSAEVLGQMKWVNIVTGRMIDFYSTYIEYDDETSEVVRVRSKELVPVPVPDKKPDVISLYRYIRPYTKDWVAVDNLQGSTLYIEIDYKHGSVNYAIASVNGENFNKVEGQRLAKQNFVDGKVYTFMLDDFGMKYRVSENGILFDIITKHYNVLSPCVQRHIRNSYHGVYVQLVNGK